MVENYAHQGLYRTSYEHQDAARTAQITIMPRYSCFECGSGHSVLNKNPKGVFARVFAKVRQTVQGRDLMMLDSHCSNSFQFRKLFDIKS